MRPSDIDQVMVIEEVVFPTPWRASAYEYEITRNRLANYQVLLARVGDRPGLLIGYAGTWTLADELHISTIAVSKKWQGKGLGELLSQSEYRFDPIRLIDHPVSGSLRMAAMSLDLP